MKPFLDQEAFRQGTFKSLDITFADAIAAMLFAEEMWSRLSDGNFYAATSYWKLLLKNLRKEILTSFIKKLLGLPSLGKALAAVKIVGETTVKHMLSVLTTAAFNNQLRAYLSWRGWFFKDGRWVYNEERAHDHDAVLNKSEILSDDGWIRCWQRYEGTLGCFGYLRARPPNTDPKDLFSLGNALCDLLHKVHTKSEVCWFWGLCVELNELENDRQWLERAFKGWNRPPRGQRGRAGGCVGWHTCDSSRKGN